MRCSMVRRRIFGIIPSVTSAVRVRSSLSGSGWAGAIVAMNAKHRDTSAPTSTIETPPFSELAFRPTFTVSCDSNPWGTRTSTDVTWFALGALALVRDCASGRQRLRSVRHSCCVTCLRSGHSFASSFNSSVVFDATHHGVRWSSNSQLPAFGSDTAIYVRAPTTSKKSQCVCFDAL